MAAPAKQGSNTPAVPITAPAIREAFAVMVNQVPEAAPGDIADIIGPILQATSWEDLQLEDALPSSKTLTGVRLRVESIARKPSDKDSVTGFYLLCKGARLDTGELVKFTAGGEQAVAVLTKLYLLGALPAFVEFRSVATTSGNDAINCAVLGVDPSKKVIDG